MVTIGGGFKEYDGTPITPTLDLKQVTGENASIMFGTEEGKYTLSEFPSYKDAGVYKVYYKATYKEYTPKESYCVLGINKAKNSWTTTSSISNVFASDAPAVPKGAAKIGSVRFTYSDSENGTFTATAPTKPGEYYMKAEVKETDNYYGLSKVVKYNILDKISSVEYRRWIRRLYDGTPKIIDPLNFGSDYTVMYGTEEGKYELKEPPTFVEAGKYRIYFKMTRSDGTYYTNYVTLQIMKDNDNWTEYPNIESWMYGEKAKTPTGAAKYGEVEFKYRPRFDTNAEFTEQVPTEPGQYFMRATIADTENSLGRPCYIPFAILTEDDIVNEDDAGEIEYTATDDTAEKPAEKTNSWIVDPWVNSAVVDDPIVHTFGKAKYGEIEFSYSYLFPETETYGEYTTQEPTVPGTYKIKATVNAEGCQPLEKVFTRIFSAYNRFTAGDYSFSKRVDYDGKPQKAEEPLHDEIEGCTIKYESTDGKYDLDTPPEYTEPGSYSVHWKLTSTYGSDMTGYSYLTIIDNGSKEKNVNILGDLDGDTQITSADALVILRMSVGAEEENITLADVDGDGMITSADALAVLRASVGADDGGKIGKPITA